ncbi:MAG: ketoacyl-ACP synthase, partial [Paenibacillus sp.]|nr:ketoacyl-ACP synthase [Paenibacillus sp.]
MMVGTPVGIWGTGMYVPERILSNAELEQMVDTNDEWIVSRTGIKERRVASSEQASSDLAFHASQEALSNAGITADQLDLIIVATITPDMAFPATACILQDKLGAKRAAAFDLSAACSGFIYGLANAVNFIATGMYKHVLVVGTECLSKITDYTDRNTCILFGDGAGAVVLGPVSEGRGFRSFELGADGTGGPLLTASGGGSRNPISQNVLDNKMQYIYMAGKEVFKF